MKTYKHWLKVDECCFDVERQYKEIENYLNEYPEAQATIYQYDNSLFNKVVLLTCSQNYNDLDMDVNTGSHNLRRLSRKPSHIKERKDLQIMNGALILV